MRWTVVPPWHRRQPGLAGNNLDSDMLIVSIAQIVADFDRSWLPPKLESHCLKPVAFSVIGHRGGETLGTFNLAA